MEINLNCVNQELLAVKNIEATLMYQLLRIIFILLSIVILSQNFKTDFLVIKHRMLHLGCWLSYHMNALT